MRRALALLMVWLGLHFPAPLLAAGAADAILTQSNAALASGQYEAVQTLAASGLAETGLEPATRARLLVSRGLAYQAIGRTDEALLDFTAALQGDVLQGEERARVLFARGLSLDGQGRLEAAIGEYSAALRIAPRAAYALNNRANVYRRQGRLAEAKRDYAAALGAGTPNPQYPWYGLGQIAEAEGDAQTARGLYSRALIADSAFALARERLEALGAPVEGPALQKDTGVIVLRPPPPRGEEAIVLAPPPLKADDRPVARKPASSSVMGVPPIPVADQARPRPAAPQAAPGRGAPLRPAITEAAPQAGPMAQLGAWRSEAEARNGWTMAQQGAGAVLDGVTPVIQRAELPGRGVFYRLRVAPRSGVADLCRALAVKAIACIPARD